jgi:hypothetical protein
MPYTFRDVERACIEFDLSIHQTRPSVASGIQNLKGYFLAAVAVSLFGLVKVNVEWT